MRKLSGQSVYIGAVFVAAAAAVAYMVVDSQRTQALQGRTRQSQHQLGDIPFDGQAAYAYLEQICALGPRTSGTPGMTAQQTMLKEHFEKLGAQVTLQTFQARNPLDGKAVPMANLIVQWHPERRERILLCTHYDTRPLPDRDRVNPRGVFLGANDGGSGTALLMQLGKSMPSLGGALGVDFVFFDGEELVYRQIDPYFLGSDHFAREYAANPPPYRYLYGVLLDMVADRDLQVYYEINSIRWNDTRPLVQAIWDVARRLKVIEFIPRPGHEVNDDHLPLRNVAKIPTCDIIDFDYPHWHTQQDNVQQCSALSLAKVGWVVHEWLKQAVADPRAAIGR